MRAVIGCLIFTFLLGVYMASAHSAPIGQASRDGTVVTLTNEPCALPAVTNLPYRATWGEKGQSFEGCFSVSGQLVVAYFADRTVVVIPLAMFQPAREAGSGPRRVLM